MADALLQEQEEELSQTDTQENTPNVQLASTIVQGFFRR